MSVLGNPITVCGSIKVITGELVVSSSRKTFEYKKSDGTLGTRSMYYVTYTFPSDKIYAFVCADAGTMPYPGAYGAPYKTDACTAAELFYISHLAVSSPSGVPDDHYWATTFDLEASSTNLRKRYIPVYDNAQGASIVLPYMCVYK